MTSSKQVGDRHRFELGRRLGVVVAGVGEEVADQPFERVGSCFGSLEVDGRVAEPGADRLQVPAQREERCAQVVGDAGDEEPSCLVCFGSSLRGLAERGRHALDRLRDVRDLADPAAWDRDHQVAAGDLVDLGAQPGERRDHPAAGEPERDGEPGEQDEESGDERDERSGGTGGGPVVEVGDQGGPRFRLPIARIEPWSSSTSALVRLGGRGRGVAPGCAAFALAAAGLLLLGGGPG